MKRLTKQQIDAVNQDHTNSLDDKTMVALVAYTMVYGVPNQDFAKSGVSLLEALLFDEKVARMYARLTIFVPNVLLIPLGEGIAGAIRSGSKPSPFLTTALEYIGEKTNDTVMREVLTEEEASKKTDISYTSLFNVKTEGTVD